MRERRRSARDDHAGSNRRGKRNRRSETKEPSAIAERTVNSENELFSNKASEIVLGPRNKKEPLLVRCC